jgi:hypothetical protein
MPTSPTPQGVLDPGPLPEIPINPTVQQWFTDKGLTQIVGWRVWLSAGREYNSKDHTEADIPTNGVQMISFYHQFPYRDFVQGEDDYYLPGGRHLTGTALSDSAYQQIINHAISTAGTWPV